jgi:hypothetical protein
MHVIKNLPNLIFCMLLFFSLAGVAQQAPFVGGEGDGYDMAVWEVRTGLGEYFSNQIKIGPQPMFSGEVVRLESKIFIQQAEVKLVDITGKEVLTRDWKQSGSFSFTLPPVPAGFYFIRIQMGEKMAVKKVQVFSK